MRTLRRCTALLVSLWLLSLPGHATTLIGQWQFALKNNGTEAAESVRVQFPIVQETETQSVDWLRITPATYRLVQGVDGNKVAEVEFTDVQAGEEIVIELECRVSIKTISVDPSICTNANPPASLSVYLKSAPYIESEDPEIVAAAERIAAGAQTNYEFASAACTFVATTLRYGGFDPAARGAAWALEYGRGDCSELAALLVALCRAEGIPARFVSGPVEGVLDLGHSWAEVHIAPYGWLTFDPTYAQDGGVADCGFVRADRLILNRGKGIGWVDVPTDFLPTLGNYLAFIEGPIETFSLEMNRWSVSPQQQAYEQDDATFSFNDDFDDPSSGWYTGQFSTGGMAYEGGAFAIWCTEPSQYFFSWAPISERLTGAFQVETVARKREGQDDATYGIIIGTDDFNHYSFLVTADGWFAVNLLQNGTWQANPIDWQQTPAVKQGTESNSLRLSIEGGLATFSVNGEVVGSVELALAEPYLVGVHGESFETAPIKIRFLSFTVSEMK